MKIYGAEIHQVEGEKNANAVVSQLDVDNAVNAQSVKRPCVAATTSNITLSGLQTIDGVAINAGDRVLVKNQTLGYNNGIYVASTSNWTRSTDADNVGKVELVSGMICYIEKGSTNGKKQFILTTPNPIVLGTSTILFEENAVESTVTLPGYVTNLNYARTNVNSNYIMTSSDNYLGCTQTSAIEILLITPSADGKTVIIKDELGVSGIYPITVVSNNSDTIEKNHTSLVISRKYTSVTLMYMQGNWSII